MATWKEIWNSRNISLQNNDLLSELIRLDGFDTEHGKVSKEEWLNYNKKIAQMVSLNNTDSIFEVGCGSGAFLYPFHAGGHTVGGIDYSHSLIDAACSLWAENKVSACEAIDLSISERYDIVLSNGVFLYFPDHDYAEKVLEKMIQKSKRVIAILEVPDEAKFHESESMRKKMIGEEEYRKKYSSLKHLQFSRQWFSDIAKKHGLSIEIHDQCIDDYKNGKFRFNCILKKK